MNIACCEICPNRCKVDRNVTKGLCQEGVLPRVARAALHHWEEPVISGENGSGTIFFSGCSMRCVFCQNYEISRLGKGKAYTVDALIGAIRELEAAGANNINFVNPTHFAHVLYTVLT
ncbi:radical SAM protein, partial [bacterium]|nr:radical SAM protein [bacterium]